MKDSVIEPGKKDTEIGAVRKLSMAGTKDVLRERLEVFSPDEFLITYSVLEGPFTVKNIRTSMRLRPITGCLWNARGKWWTEFETEKGKEEEGEQFMAGVPRPFPGTLKRHLGV